MQSHEPLVTVYVVNHNYGRYVGAAIDSVLAQTMKGIELIVIDDGSTDGSRGIIERYCSHENVFIIAQQNKGLAVTNNIALRMATGRYIMRLDADDYLDPRAVAILVSELERDPSVGLVFPDYYLVDEHGVILEQVRRHDFDRVTVLDQPAHGACTLIRRTLLEELGGYDEAFNCQDGFDLWLRFVERFGVKNVNLPLFYYRRHGANLTGQEGRILDTRAAILKKHALTRGRSLRTICVIPVRDQRTDPRSIAFRTLGSKPVIDWTIEAALNAERIEATIVSTPDRAILEHVENRYGDAVLALPRDVGLAQLNSFTRTTLAHALDQYAARRSAPDAVAELFIEYPFRTSHAIDAAVDVLEIFATDRVISVRSEVDSFFAHEGNGMVPFRGSRRLRLESEEIYRAIGAVSVTRTPFLESDHAYDCARLGHVTLDQKASFCIRSDWDWDIARFEAARRTSEEPSDFELANQTGRRTLASQSASGSAATTREKQP